jgi:Galactokinase
MKLNVLYNDSVAATARYENAIKAFEDYFNCSAVGARFFSAPGRTEICGNHTDHNHGKAVAGAVSLDVIAVVVPREDGIIHIKSEGYPEDEIDISRLLPVEEEKNKAAAIIRGVVARFAELGHKIGGFNAYTTSNILKGSGLSSSAGFEVLICTILDGLFGGGGMDPITKAKISQYAENVYFGKPSGLLDQMASAFGGIISIDFASTENPVVTPLECDFAKSETALCTVDVGGDHADLTHEYATITEEMRQVSEALGANYLIEVSQGDFYAALPVLREKFGDRACVRAIHFFEENKRVDTLVGAVTAGDWQKFFDNINASGRSSIAYLQNIYSHETIASQGITLALALSEIMLDGNGACRVHGGGFGGTTQNFVPLGYVDSFKNQIEEVFGKGSCHVLSIRPYGGVEVEI